VVTETLLFLYVSLLIILITKQKHMIALKKLQKRTTNMKICTRIKPRNLWDI